MISIPGGAAPSRQDVASIYHVMKPVIESHGYEVARNLRSADYAVYVSDPLDPLGSTGGRVTFVRVEANESSNSGVAAAVREFKIKSEKAIAEMIREPK